MTTHSLTNSLTHSLTYSLTYLLTSSVLGIVLFALQIEDLKKDKGNCRVFLNPAQFVIPENDGELDIVAFVLAKNKAQSDLSFSSGTHLLTHLLTH